MMFRVHLPQVVYFVLESTVHLRGLVGCNEKMERVVLLKKSLLLLLSLLLAVVLAFVFLVHLQLIVWMSSHYVLPGTREIIANIAEMEWFYSLDFLWEIMT